jgi:hypothetical protein
LLPDFATSGHGITNFNAMSKDLLISVSGGRSSAMVARHIQTNDKYKDFNKVYVFANTGMERPETIDFLKNIEKHWGIDLIKVEGVYSTEMGVGIKHKIVEWDELDMKAKVFENAIEHKNKGDYSGLPNQAAPFCSGTMKTMPIEHFAKTYLEKDYLMAIGMRKEDMPKRITWAEIREEKRKIYPLITDFEYPIGQHELNIWWSKQPFKLEIHGKLGNCELCWKKSTTNLVETIRHGTRFVDWIRTMEAKYEDTMFRNRMSIDELVKLAEQPTTMKIEFEDEGDMNCVCSF